MNITLRDTSFRLMIIVRNLDNHFTCAVSKKDGNWVNIDDCFIFPLLTYLPQRFSEGLIFSAYCKIISSATNKLSNAVAHGSCQE